MARLRESRPDLADQLTATSAALTSAVGSLLRDLLPPEPGEHRPAGTPSRGPGESPPGPTPAATRPPVERIEIAE